MSALKKNISSLTYANFGLVTLLIVVATPLIRLLYGTQWDQSIPYFQILCISGMFLPLNNMNVSVIKALGKSKVLFFSHISYKSIGIIALFVGGQFGVEGLLWAVVFSALVMYFMTSAINHRLIGYGVYQQIKDVGGNLLVAIIAGFIAHLAGLILPLNQFVVMFIQVAIYLSIYIGISLLVKLDGFFTYKDIVTDYINIIKNR